MRSLKSKTIDGFTIQALQLNQLKKVKGKGCCGGEDQPPPPPKETTQVSTTSTSVLGG